MSANKPANSLFQLAGDEITVFHQGPNGDGLIWCNTLRQRQWTGDVQVPKTGIYASPSAILFPGAQASAKTYLFHQGPGTFSGDWRLWYNILEGETWSGDKVVPWTPISDHPSAVVYNGLIYVFYQGPDNSGGLHYNIYLGGRWAGDVAVPKTGMSAGPSACVYRSQIFVFHQGYGLNGELWYNVFDGPTKKWVGDKQVPRTGMSHGPSAVAFKDRLYVFHHGPNDDGQLWYNVYNGRSWRGDRQVPKVGISGGPAAAVANLGANVLVVFHQGPQDSGELWVTYTQDGDSWSTDEAVPKTGISADPSAVARPT